MVVLLPSEFFAERLHVRDERVDGFLERESGFSPVEDLDASLRGCKVQLLSMLGFQGFGGSIACGLPQTFSVLAPFDEEATARVPFEAAPLVAF